MRSFPPARRVTCASPDAFDDLDPLIPVARRSTWPQWLAAGVARTYCTACNSRFTADNTLQIAVWDTTTGELSIEEDVQATSQRRDGRTPPLGLLLPRERSRLHQRYRPGDTMKFNSVFEILFAPEHEGWLLDVKAGTAKKIANLPRDGVGFESHRMDGRLWSPVCCWKGGATYSA